MKLFIAVIILQIQSFADQVKVKNCSYREEVKAISDTHLARELIKSIIAGASKELAINHQHYQHIVHTLSCINKKLNTDLNIKCKPKHRMCKDRKADYFVIKLTKTIYICPQVLESRIDFRLEYKPEFRAAMIIHEVSHLCGTEDLGYFTWEDRHDPIPITETKNGREVDIWHKNADTYQYWARFGFCIPGVSCQH